MTCLFLYNGCFDLILRMNSKLMETILYLDPALCYVLNLMAEISNNGELKHNKIFLRNHFQIEVTYQQSNKVFFDRNTICKKMIISKMRQDISEEIFHPKQFSIVIC